MSTAELAASYAALILADDGVEVTVSALPPTANPPTLSKPATGRPDILLISLLLQADKLQSLISAAKVADVEPIWTTLFAKARVAIHVLAACIPD